MNSQASLVEQEPKRKPKTSPTINGSTYVKPQDLKWQKTQFDKVWLKVLYEDRAKGESTVLIKLEPGAHLPFHKHPELEQAYVLEGSMYDHDGKCGAGEYVWRKAGSFHENRSDTGEARSSKEFVVIGRTDAYASYGLEEAIRRAQAYEQAGADATMIMLVNKEADLRAVSCALAKPTTVLMSEKLNPLILPQKLRALGYPLVIYPLSLIKATVHAQKELAQYLKTYGTTQGLLNRVAPLEKINQLLGLQDSAVIEQRYADLVRARSAATSMER